MSERELAGYWPSPWPAEDGGPTRRQAAHATAQRTGFDLSGAARLRATTRIAPAATMPVLREPDEVFLLSHTIGPDCVSWVERLHPESLEPLVRSPDLAGGPFWPGGFLAHADGSLYVTFGRWCHRLDPVALTPMASRQLPRDRPYNSLVALPGRLLAMKDIGGGVGRNRLPPDVGGSELVLLAPGDLEVADRLELPEGSIARLSAADDDLYVVGESAVHRVRVDPIGALTRDDTWAPRYRTVEGQTYGWDPVIAAGAAWFLDNGEGSEDFAGSFRGISRSSAPLHLVRVALGADAVDQAAVELVEVDGRPGGVIANPPAVDDGRGIVVGYDSGHGTLAAWRFDEHGIENQLWRREQHHAGHLLRFPDSGQLLTCDFDHDRGVDQVVVLDIVDGTELGRVDTASPVQSVLFPAPGWAGDAYVCTFAGVSRVFTD